MEQKIFTEVFPVDKIRNVAGFQEASKIQGFLNQGYQVAAMSQSVVKTGYLQDPEAIAVTVVLQKSDG